MGRPLAKKDHKISKHEAKEYTRRYRDRKDKHEPLPSLLPLAFHRDGYDRILNQPGCVGIRSYPALHTDGQVTLVLVGIDADGNDLVDGELAQDGEICPPHCSDPNELNGEG